MNNKEQQTNFYRNRAYGNTYRQQFNRSDSDWEFQKVQSVYEVNQDQLTNTYRQPSANLQFKMMKNSQNQKYNYHEPKDQTYKKSYLYQRLQQPHKITVQNMAIPHRNPSSKTNSQTNIISQSQSLEYLSSQQPSFSNKGQFTVCEDFNIDLISPVKTQRPIHQQNSNQDWQLASFASNNRKTLTLSQKCIGLHQSVQELKFMKEGLESKLKLQKINFANQIQDLKKIIFKLNIKYQKQILQFTQNETKPMSRQSSFRQSVVKDENILQNQFNELKKHCQYLEQQQIRSQQKYQSTLKKYQEEIELISKEFEKKLALERSSHWNLSHKQFQCINCVKDQRSNKQKKDVQIYEVEIWKNRLREEQENHSKAMKRLQEKVLMLHEEFQILQKQKSQTQKTLKQKEKQIVYREAEIQYRFKNIQRRQRDLGIAESLLEKHRQELERKKDKIADYELKVFKEQRRHKNQIKEKQIMTSEYFSNCDKKKILSKANPHGDRSDSLSSKSSRIYINARLKEIQMMRNRGSRNYDQNATSRNSSKDSRSSGYKDYGTSSVSFSNRNLKDYGITPSSSIPPKQHNRGNSQSVKLSEKLNKLTQILHKQLREIE